MTRERGKCMGRKHLVGALVAAVALSLSLWTGLSTAKERFCVSPPAKSRTRSTSFATDSKRVAL